MMEEVITRHFTRLLKENKPMPDLLMVDGGKGQLSSALKVLNKLNCYTFPVIGLAEKNEEIYLPNQDKPLVLDRHDPALKMLQALRDETHRFAITYHRNLRQKAIEHSLLDDIPGIGKTRKMQLLKEFGSLTQLRKVSALEICEKIPNIGESLANKIVEYINK
jgi:excinuclease ABC subunit C